MKRFLSYGLMGCVMGLSSVAAWAQTPQVVDRGGVVELNAPDGYKSYQWQVSSDLKNFYNLPEGNVQKMSLKAYARNYYRVKTVSESNKTAYMDTVEVKMTEKTYASNYSVSGGAHGFLEWTDGTPGASGISLPEDREGSVAGTTKKLTKWTNGKAMAVYYINHPKNIIDTEMYFKLNKNANVTFRITVWDPSKMETPLAENIVAVKGTGEEQKVDLVGLSIPRKTYYRYQLECLNGWNDIIEISKYHHYSPSGIRSFKSGYLSSPSVHLNNWRSTKSGAPSGFNYDWCYEEVMMPKESDIPGTYVMSLGVLRGYMGIQMNGWNGDKSLHEVIFSMWDDGDTDSNPDLPANLRANVLDLHKDAVAERFGNEGTGMKTFLHGHHWECGTYVQFLTNCRPEKSTYTVIVNGKEQVRTQNNMLVSTWFNAQDGKGWQYMATLRLPNRTEAFDSWYSFLENYNYPTGQVLRRGFYRNGYGRDRNSKQWYHFNRVDFGHTDGGNAVGARNDFGIGTYDEEPGTFFMTTGGFIPAKQTKNQVPLNKVDTPVDTINLDALLVRVDQAIEHERQQIEREENFKKNKLDKKGWKVVKFSSEETSGEGSNGRAALVIDGNVETYWHSKWTGGGAKYPHFLVVDMKAEYDINGMQITMSGGNHRYIKSFNLYVSDNNRTWTKVYSEKEAPNEETFNFMLDKSVAARYFKLEITDGRAGDGDFVRINEIEVTGKPVQTSIGSVEASNSKFDVTCSNGELLVKSAADASDVLVALYAADGSCIYSHNYATLTEGEVVSIPMFAAPNGVYVVTCKSKNVNYNKQVVWNN